MIPPTLDEHETILTNHGYKRTDNYYWVRNQEKNKNKRRKVLKYIKKENSFSKNLMSDTEKLQQNLFNEFKSRTKENHISTPAFQKGYYYYNQIKKGDNYRKYYRKIKLNDKPQLILDCMKLSKNLEFFDLGDYEISPDNKSLLYCIDTDGNEKYELYIRNIKTGKIKRELNLEIEPDFVWGYDSNSFFYVIADDSKRPYQIWKHIIGSNEKDDILIYEELNVLFNVGISKTNDDKYIIIMSNSSSTTECYYIRDDKIYLIQKRTKGHQYSIEHHNGYFYILTNKDKSTNFKIMRTSVSQTNKNKWINYIPYNQNIYITELHAFQQFLVIECKIDGQYAIKIIDFENKNTKIIKYDEVCNIYLDSSLNLEFNTNEIIYTYSSLITPPIIYKYNMKTSEQQIIRKYEYKNYNPDLYKSERILIDTETKLYVSVVYRKNLFIKNGTNPGHLYAYGSYGEDVDVDYDKYIISLLDRGYIYAIAHVRGSSYLGKQWYEQGKLMKKKNTFKDFIKCSEYLIQNNYISKQKLSISGGSAGGLLIGAVINKKPSLYKTAILEVPFVDCLTTMLDSSIPLTTGEYEEWGNPEKYKTFYKYILSYSPIDNIKNKLYPNILITSGINDTRVGFWEPVKYCAKMRKIVSSFKKNRDIMMKIDLNSGHGGSSERYKYMQDEAFKYAFIIKYT